MVSTSGKLPGQTPRSAEKKRVPLRTHRTSPRNLSPRLVPEHERRDVAFAVVDARAKLIAP